MGYWDRDWSNWFHTVLWLFQCGFLTQHVGIWGTSTSFSYMVRYPLIVIFISKNWGSRHKPHLDLKKKHGDVYHGIRWTTGMSGSKYGDPMSSEVEACLGSLPWWFPPFLLGFCWVPTWRWFYPYGYGSIPINTIFRGMNIHLPAILMFTRGTRFWHTAIWFLSLLSRWCLMEDDFSGSIRGIAIVLLQCVFWSIESKLSAMDFRPSNMGKNMGNNCG